MQLGLASSGDQDEEEEEEEDLHDDSTPSLSHALATPSARVGDLVALALAFRVSPYLIVTKDGGVSTAGPAALIGAVTGLVDPEPLSKFMQRYLPNKSPVKEGKDEKRNRLQSHPLVVVASASTKTSEVGFEFVLDRSSTAEAAHADLMGNLPEKWQDSRRTVITLTTELSVLGLMQDTGLLAQPWEQAVQSSMGNLHAIKATFSGKSILMEESEEEEDKEEELEEE